jgi:predicted Zn-dependent peptidase
MLAPLPRGERPAVAPPQFAPNQLKRRYGIAQTCLQWMMPAPAIASPAYYQHVIANHILGGGTTSRLFHEIREQRGLVYGIHSQLDAYSDAGVWSIQTACDPENGSECRDAVERSAEVLLSQGPSATEITTTRRFARANLLLEQENLEGSMERLAREMIYLGRQVELEEHLQKFDAVTADSARDALAEAWPRRAFGLTAP